MDKVEYRTARYEDVPRIVMLLADDELGSGREQATGDQGAATVNIAYYDAFKAITGDANNELLVAQSNVQSDGSVLRNTTVIAVLQLSYLPSMTYQGAWRAQIEGVRVAREWRGSGVGRAFLNWAIQRARVRHCVMVQLTTDKQRPQAIDFYQSLGFTASHEGMKLHLQ